MVLCAVLPIVEASDIGYTRVFRRRSVGFFFWLRSVRFSWIDTGRCPGKGARASRRGLAGTTARQVAIERVSQGRGDSVGQSWRETSRCDKSQTVRGRPTRRLQTVTQQTGALAPGFIYNRISPKNDSATRVLHHSYTPRYCRSCRVNSVQPNVFTVHNTASERRAPRSITIFAQ